MAVGSQRRILQIQLFSTLPKPQTTRLEHFDAHWKSYLWIPHLLTFCSYVLVVDGTVDGKDNKDIKSKQPLRISSHASIFYAIPISQHIYFNCVDNSFHVLQFAHSMWLGYSLRTLLPLHKLPIFVINTICRNFNAEIAGKSPSKLNIWVKSIGGNRLSSFMQKSGKLKLVFFKSTT